MQDDFADLAAFAILCDSGSFTRAAERLGCSKGQLSKRIRALEMRLETQLLHRTTRRLDPTPLVVPCSRRPRPWCASASGPCKAWPGCRRKPSARCA